MDVIVGRAVRPGHTIAPFGVAHSFAVDVSSEDNGFWVDRDALELGAKAPADEQPGDIGGDLDAGTDLAQGACRLNERDRVACVGETVGRRETSKTASYDEDVQLAFCLASSVQMLLDRSGTRRGDAGRRRTLGAGPGAMDVAIKPAYSRESRWEG